MPKIKRFLALVCCLVVVVLAVPVQVHADPLTAGAAASIFQMWAQSYGMQVGGATFGFSGVDQGEAVSWITDTFNEWQTSEVHAGHQQSVQSISSYVSDFLNNVVMEKVYLGLNSPIANAYGLALKIGDTVAGSLDRFWEFYLTKLGFTYDYQEHKWVKADFSASDPITVFSTPTAGPIYQSMDGVYNSQWNFAGYRNGNAWYVASSGPNVFVVSTLNAVNYPGLTFVCTENTYVTYMSGGYSNSYALNKAYTYEERTYYYSDNPHNVNFIGIPFPFVEGGYPAAIAYVDGILQGTIDNTGAEITLDPYGEAVDDGALPFPKTDDVDYDPAAVDVNVSVPWDPAWDDLTGDALGEAVGDAAQDLALQNELTLTEEAEAPPIDNTDTIGPAADYLVPGLSTVFPFCIPFDIYNFLSALAAEPAAPSFSCTLAFPAALGGPQTVVIDFDTPVFNQLAQLLRLLELLAFIVGLAFVTRSMFIRG